MVCTASDVLRKARELALRHSKLLALTTLAFALTAGSAQAADLTPAKAEALEDLLGSKGAGAYFDAAPG